MSKYGLLDPGTCLPVLEAVCHVYDIDNALEFGAGLWSTYCLTRNCKTVTSVENVEAWCDVIRAEHSHRNNLHVVYWDAPMHHYFKTINDTFDLIFIDGNDRVECLNESFSYSPIIICHDTHASALHWDKAIVPESYKQLTYVGCLPYYTTIFYHEETNLADQLLNHLSYTHKNTFIDSTFWTTDDIIAIHKRNAI